MRWALKFFSRFLLFALITMSSCSITRPCTRGGELSWPSQIRGDKICQQTKLPDGRKVNHGRFVQRYGNGKIALEGEYNDGLMHGRWTQYSPEGKSLLEKNFHNGIEIFPSARATVKPDEEPPSRR
jgi:hypothetical protein